MQIPNIPFLEVCFFMRSYNCGQTHTPVYKIISHETKRKKLHSELTITNRVQDMHVKPLVLLVNDSELLCMHPMVLLANIGA